MDTIERLYDIQKNKDHNQLSFLKNNIPLLIEREFNERASRSNNSGRMVYVLSELINMNVEYRHYIIQRLSSDFNTEIYSDKLNNIFEVFIYGSQYAEIQMLLDKILNSNSMEVKKIFFYYNLIYPIPYYIQLEKFRKAIVSYINSDFFKKDFEKLKEHFGKNNPTLHAFPTQYVQTFNFKDFDPSFKEGLSVYMEQKLIKKYRLDSIRLIEDDQLKNILVKRYYYSHLTPSYKNKFIKLIRKEIPDLELDWI